MFGRRSESGIKRVTSICAMCVFAWGCHPEPDVHGPTPSDRAAIQQVCCTELKHVMDELNKTYRKAHRLQLRRLRGRQFATLDASARRIAEHADLLKSSADLSRLTPEEVKLFDRLAETLRTTAKAMSDAAAKEDRLRSHDLFAKLTSTCNTCHAAFRGSAGR